MNKAIHHADDETLHYIGDLEREIAKLRKEHDAALRLAYARAAAAEQRAEAAEARIKEAEGQEPVAYIYPAAYGSRASLCKENKPQSWDDGDDAREWYETPLYPRPIPPADVAELERHVVEKSRKIGEMQRSIAELEREVTRLSGSSGYCAECERLSRKLAEQQAGTDEVVLKP